MERMAGESRARGSGCRRTTVGIALSAAGSMGDPGGGAGEGGGCRWWEGQRSGWEGMGWEDRRTTTPDQEVPKKRRRLAEHATCCEKPPQSRQNWFRAPIRALGGPCGNKTPLNKIAQPAVDRTPGARGWLAFPPSPRPVVLASKRNHHQRATLSPSGPADSTLADRPARLVPVQDRTRGQGRTSKFQRWPTFPLFRRAPVVRFLYEI